MFCIVTRYSYYKSRDTAHYRGNISITKHERMISLSANKPIIFYYGFLSFVQRRYNDATRGLHKCEVSNDERDIFAR